MKLPTIGMIALLGTVLTACNSDSPEVEIPRVMAADGTMKEPDSEDQELARVAIDTLARELGISPDSITVDTIRAVEWRDSSMGCPQPDAAYLQVLTPGHRITLRVGKQLHFVHEAKGRAFVCKRSKLAVGGVTEKRELVWGPQAVAARKDLAARLGVDEQQVKVAAAQGTSWPDASLGCPEQGAEYAPGPVEGYILRLRHGQRDYIYHTDLERVFPCPPIANE